MNFVLTFAYVVCSFLALGTLGLLAGWVDRKVTARVQWRVGPPWYQNFADLVKLSGKEVLIPESANRLLFLAAPVIGLAGATACGSILLLVLGNAFGFPGDLVLFAYLLALPPLAIILGGSASGNVLASTGISRELKLLLAYELPFICAIVVAAVKAGSTTSLVEILRHQQDHRLFLFSLSGVLGFVISVLALTAKLGFVPFDAAEAETEIAGGTMIEYSGILLGLFKLMKAILLVVGPLFVVTLFLGGISFATPLSAVMGVLKYVLVLVLLVLIKNTNPRLRIDQAVRFFWGWLTVFGLAALALAFLGW